MDLRIVIYGLWALGSMIVWGLVLRDDIRQYRFLRERRIAERRRLSVVEDLWSDFALVLVAIAAGLSILAFVGSQETQAIRGFLLAISLGAFLGAGLVKYSFRRRR